MANLIVQYVFRCEYVAKCPGYVPQSMWQTLSIHHMSPTLSPRQNIKAHNNNKTRNACVRGNLSITNLLKGMALVMSVSMHVNIFMLHSELDLRPY